MNQELNKNLLKNIPYSTPLLGEHFIYDKTAPLIAYIEECIKNFSENIAIEDHTSSITYAQLGIEIQKFSEAISVRGLMRGDRVGIYCAPSINMIIAILSLVKMGVCYTPIDASYPKDRVDYIIAKSELKSVITDKNIPSSSSLLDINLFSNAVQTEGKKPTVFGSSNDPAYIMFTSGSTGSPKGVIITQLAIINHMLWMKNQFNIKADDKVLLRTPIGFDPSVWEIFLPLFCGAAVVIAAHGAHYNPKLMISLINKHRVSIIQLVPAILDELLKEAALRECVSLKYVFVGGESLKLKTKMNFFKTLHARLINLYGLTETTIDCTFHEVIPGISSWEKNCIGRPIYNTAVYVLNQDFVPCAVGEIGELYVSGDALSVGYFKNPIEEEKRFFYISDLQAKLYKTGDLGRWTADGNIEFIGRNDEQIKINGVRFEPNEMIHFIVKHFSIDTAHLLKYESGAGYASLICFLVTSRDIDLDKLKKMLADHFPSYVIPKHFLILRESPLTPHGKIDKEFLINAFKQRQEVKSKYKSAHILDMKLHKIWAEILGDDIYFSNEDDFCSAGGDSLAMVALMVAIEKAFDISIDLDTLATATTIHAQKEMIKKLSTKNQSSHKSVTDRHILCLKTTGHQTPLFLVHPIGGTVFWYKHLVKLLKTDRKIYAIQDPAIFDFKMRFHTISEMAQYYVASIRKIQPRGPYLLGGASFGATVSLEIARILAESGQVIEHIFNFDGWALHPKELGDKNYFATALEGQKRVWEHHFTMIDLYHTELDKFLDIQMHRFQMLYQYELKKIPWKMTLFKAKETMPIFKIVDDPYNHWLDYAEGNLIKLEVPGDHETMFQPPFVEKIAEELDKLLLSTSSLQIRYTELA